MSYNPDWLKKHSVILAGKREWVYICEDADRELMEIVEERDVIIKSACVCGSCNRWEREDERCLAFDRNKSRKETCESWDAIK